MEIVKCHFFMITKLNKKYWYFAFFLIGSILRVIIPDIPILKSNLNIFSKNDLKTLLTLKYLEITSNVASDILFGIFHCIYFIRNKEDYKKRKKFKYNKNSIKINFIFNDESRRTPRIFKLLLIISFVDFTCQLLLPLKYIIEDSLDMIILSSSPFHFNSLLVIDIISRYLFSLWILRTYFYAHHYFSFLLNFIALLTLGVVDFIFKFSKNSENDHNKYDLLYIFVIALQYILYSLEDIMNKVALRTLYILPTTLIFYKGLFELIFLLPINYLFFFLFKLYDFSFLSENKNSLYLVLYFITFIPFNILRTFSLVNVIDKFTAQHMSFLKVSEAIALFVYYICIGEEKRLFNLESWAYIIQILSFLILLISSLIHNEIIIINHPKLKAKTEYFLDRDANKEKNDTSYYSNSLLSDSRNISSTVSNLYSDLSQSEL